MKWPALPRFGRRRDGPAADSTLRSRGPGASLLAASRWHSAQPSEHSTWLSTGLAGDARWTAPRPVDEERLRRQFRSTRRWALAGAVLGAFIGLVAFAPAQWLADGVASATGGRVLLAEARGTVWNGSAVPVLTGGPGSRDAAHTPGRLAWTIRPHWRGLVVLAQQPCCLPAPLRLQWQPGFGGWSLQLIPSNADTGVSDLGQWPTAWLAGLGAPWNTLQLGGAMQVESNGLKLSASAGRLRMEGAVSVQVRDLSSRLSPLPSLGSYRLVLQGAPDGASGSQLQLQTTQGPLQLQGSGQWGGNGLRFRGQAQAEAGHEAALANLLNIMGRRQGALSVISIG